MRMATVLWADACQVGGTAWTDARRKNYPVLSVGLIMNETEETLQLARDYDGDSVAEWRAVIAIPKSLILRRRNYRVAGAFLPVPNDNE